MKTIETFKLIRLLMLFMGGIIEELGIVSTLKKKKVCIVHHNDADGICSAAILAITMKRLGNFPIKIISPKFTEFDDEITKELEEIRPEFIVVLDMSLNTLRNLKNLHENYLVIDHHPFDGAKDSRVIHSTKNCASYLTFEFCSKFSRINDISWIAGIGCLADKDIDGFRKLRDLIYENYPELNDNLMKVMMCFVSSSRVFGQKGLFYGVNALIEAAEMQSPTAILGSTPNSQKLLKLRKFSIAQRNYWLLRFNEIADFDEESKSVFLKINSKFFIQNYLAGTISNLYPNHTCFVINEGLDEKYAIIEARTKNNGINLGKIMNDICSHFEDCSGGGHKQAAGAKVPKISMNKFIDSLKLSMRRVRLGQ